MKYFLFCILLCTCMLQVNSQFTYDNKLIASGNTNYREGDEITFQEESGSGRMRSVVFKNQEYCRLELKDFEFEAPFSIVSATAYFSGKNFENIQKGFITSSSLKPLRKLMDLCEPGSIVIFDDVKIMGPDKELRTIRGIHLVLY